MSKIEIILDFAHKRIGTIPSDLLEKRNLRMLYLEDNALETLPLEFFVNFQNLVWLDLRKNYLTTLPASIAGHNCLETLLLQDNLFQALPLEIGLIPNLKVLQLTGNPLRYPDTKILEKGTKTILEFLQKEHQFMKALEESSSEEVVQTASLDGTINDISNKSEENLVPVVKIKKANTRKRLKPCKLGSSKSLCTTKKYSKSNVYKNKPHYNSNKYVGSQQELPKKDIKSQVARDMWLNALKMLLQKQEQNVQREKDLESLKNWRQSVINKSKTEGLEYKPEAPYDTDPMYETMFSRSDTRMSCRKKKVYKPREQVNVEKLLKDISDSLKLIERRDPQQKTTEGANKEIKWILDLQKRLSTLKLHNNIEME